jgi:hypothetical protein
MRRRTVVTTVVVVLAVAGAANAYMTSGGSGTATASTAAPPSASLGPGSPAAALRPGGVTDVVLAATNPGPAAAHVASLVLDTTRGTGGFAVDAGHAGCAPTSFALSAPSYDAGGAGWTVPAASGSTPGSLTVTLPQALTMRLDASNACQGATVTVHLRAGS